MTKKYPLMIAVAAILLIFVGGALLIVAIFSPDNGKLPGPIPVSTVSNKIQVNNQNEATITSTPIISEEKLQETVTRTPEAIQWTQIQFSSYIQKCPKGENPWLNLYGLEATEENTLYAYGSMGDIYGGSILLKSKDGGKSWEQIFETIPHNSILFMTFIDADHGWLLSAWSVEAIYDLKLYRTIDGGLNWEYVSTIPMEYWYGYPTRMQFFSVLDGEFDLVYSVGAPATNKISYMKTEDGGITWFEDNKRPITDASDTTAISYYRNLPDQNISWDSDNNIWFLNESSSFSGYILQEYQNETHSWENMGNIPSFLLCAGNGLIINEE